MKLDVNVLRYLSKEDFRVLTSVEMGQKNVSPRAAEHVWGLSMSGAAADMQFCCAYPAA
jgi:hypothetical protein